VYCFSDFLLFQSAKRFSCSSLVGLSTLIFVGLFGLNLPASANPTRFSLELPMENPANSLELTQQAESLMCQTITQVFNQNPQLESVEVVININRQGDILPLMTTIVARSQWQAAPSLQQWSKYYGVYQQFKRPQPIVQAPPNSVQANNQSATTFALDRARDRGQLSGETAQRHLNRLD
jgi:hypothetical protein